MATKTFKLNQEDMERMASNLQKLPEACYAFMACNPVGERIIIIKRGEIGYYPFRQADGTKDTKVETIRKVVDELNERLGVTEEQKQAMLMGSMNGYHVPGADPDSDFIKQIADKERERKAAGEVTADI